MATVITEKQKDKTLTSIKKVRFDAPTIINTLMDLHVQKMTCIMRVLKKSDLYINIIFSMGEIRDIQRHPLEAKHCLGRLFHAAGKIEQNDVVESFKRSRENNSKQGNELVNMGKISQSELNIVLMNQMELKFAEIFSWETGILEVFKISRLPGSYANIPLDFPRFIFRMIFKHFPEENAQQFCRKYYEYYVNKAEDSPFQFSQFSQDRNLRNFWEKVLARENQIKRIFITSNRNQQQTAKLLMGFYLMRMIKLFEEPQVDASQERAALLAEKLMYIDKEDYFNLLQVHWSCNADQLRKAWQHYEEEMAKQKAKAGELERSYLQQYDDYLRKAYEYLLSDENRQNYRKMIYDESFVEFNSEIWRQKAESFLFTKDDPAEALENIKIALEIWQSNSEYWALYALSLMNIHRGKNYQMVMEAKRVMNKALSMAQPTEVVYLCEGLMYKLEGKQNQAITSLEKALKIDSDNKFIKVTLHEVKTGEKHPELQDAIKEFVNRKSISDKKFDEMVAQKITDKKK